MKIVFASGNKHKIEEFGAILRKYIPDIELVSMKEAGIFDDIVEDGATFEENAMIKARAVAKYGYIGVADDSGLTVDALGGAPGVYSARYAGEHGDDEANNALLLKNMEDKEDKTARFVCTIACVFPKSFGDIEPIVVRGEVEGQITDKRSGNGGFGYDPYFYYPPFGKTLADVTAEEKNSVSHRGKAIRLLAERLTELGIK